MFNISEDIHSLTDFKRHTSNYVKKIKYRRRPMVLTINGKAAIIVQDAGSYQKLVELADQYEALSFVQKGIAQSKKGNVISLEKFDKHMRKKHAILR
ncbi:MAG: type II toxin-antitoxin system Phd/YefM family antitoxin [Elusimicrobiota bacterium]